MRRRDVLLLAWALMCAGAHGFASAQPAYPSKPIRLVVPLAPGGPSDHMARALTQKLTEGIKQTIIVDNRPGASGVIGTEIVAKSPADGYTLLLVQGAFTANASLVAKLPYDTLRDFEPISQLTAGRPCWQCILRCR